VNLSPVSTGNDVKVIATPPVPQSSPSVTALADGGFVVTWEGATYQDRIGYVTVYGQRYSADGAEAGDALRIQDFSYGHHDYSVAALDDGGFVVTWVENARFLQNAISGLRYAADGTVVGSVGTPRGFAIVGEPSVTALTGGGFVATWSSNGLIDLSGNRVGNGILCRLYAADGTTVGDEFVVHTFSENDQFGSTTSALLDGGFIVTWSSSDGSGWGIYGQRYASNGATVGGEFRANTHTAGDQSFSSSTGLADGGFIVTWSSESQDGSGWGIYGQRYAADSTVVGGEFRVNAITIGDQVYSSIVSVADGGFVVTWQSNNQDGSGWGVFGQRYAADGIAVGEQFQANQLTDGDQLVGSNAIATLADGRLVQVWSGPAEQAFFRLLEVPLLARDNVYVALQDGFLAPSGIDGVLANDAAVHAALLTGPEHGSVDLVLDGSFIYAPAAGFSGIDPFTYRASDGLGATNDANVLIHVVPVVRGSTTTLDLLALTAEEQVASIYAAFLGRGPDADGFAFWIGQLNTGLPNQGAAAVFANVSSSFGVSDEAKALYPFLVSPFGASDAQIANFLVGIFDTLFDRLPDTEGFAYWTEHIKHTLTSGQFVGSVLLDILSGAQNTAAGQDITTVMSKVVVGIEYVKQQLEWSTQWTKADDQAEATALLHAVTNDPQTLLIGIAQAQNLVVADLV